MLPQTTIIAKQVTRKGYNFVTPTKTINRSQYKFFALDTFDFLKVDTASETQPKQLMHGHYSGFTRNITRYVTMSFGAFAYTESERWDLIKTVDSIFQPPSNPTPSNQGYDQLAFRDVDDVVRDMQARVVDRIDVSDFANDHWITFRVRLLVKDNSCMYANNYTLNDTNRIMGVTLEETLGFPLFYSDALQVDYEGVSSGPIKVTITATVDNPTLGYVLVRMYRPDGSQSLLYLDNIYMMTGDVLVVDSYNTIITLNGFDITGQIKLPFDTFPRMENLAFVGPFWTGDNMLIVDCGNPLPVLDVQWQWRDTWC